MKNSDYFKSRYTHPAYPSEFSNFNIIHFFPIWIEEDVAKQPEFLQRHAMDFLYGARKVLITLEYWVNYNPLIREDAVPPKYKELDSSIYESFSNYSIDGFDFDSLYFRKHDRITEYLLDLPQKRELKRHLAEIPNNVYLSPDLHTNKEGLEFFIEEGVFDRPYPIY